MRSSRSLASIAMIDRHYGHLANDGRDDAVCLLDALAFARVADAAVVSLDDERAVEQG